MKLYFIAISFERISFCHKTDFPLFQFSKLKCILLTSDKDRKVFKRKRKIKKSIKLKLS